MYVESFTCAKDPTRPDLNEDRLVVHGDTTFAVIDGVTSKSAMRYGQLTSGVLAARALARRLAELSDDGTLAYEPATEVVARLNTALAAEHERWHIAERVARDPAQRFAAGLMVAHLRPEGLRLIAVGDCGARLNGRPLAHRRNRLDDALAAVRSAVFAALSQLQPDVSLERRLEVARAYTVHGVASEPPGVDLDTATHNTLAARARDAAAAKTADWPEDIAANVVDGGLLAVSALRRLDTDGTSPLSRAGLDLGVLDGHPLDPALVFEASFPVAELEVLELYTDGYFGSPAEHGRVAHWEAHHRHVEQVDPHRVGEFASTKGSYGGRNADDRTVLVVRREPPAA